MQRFLVFARPLRDGARGLDGLCASRDSLPSARIAAESECAELIAKTGSRAVWAQILDIASGDSWELELPEPGIWRPRAKIRLHQVEDPREDQAAWDTLPEEMVSKLFETFRRMGLTTREEILNALHTGALRPGKRR